MFNARGIVKPRRLEFEKQTKSDVYGKFSAGPFLKKLRQCEAPCRPKTINHPARHGDRENDNTLTQAPPGKRKPGHIAHFQKHYDRYCTEPCDPARYGYDVPPGSPSCGEKVGHTLHQTLGHAHGVDHSAKGKDNNQPINKREVHSAQTFPSFRMITCCPFQLTAASQPEGVSTIFGGQGMPSAGAFTRLSDWTAAV